MEFSRATQPIAKKLKYIYIGINNISIYMDLLIESKNELYNKINRKYSGFLGIGMNNKSNCLTIHVNNIISQQTIQNDIGTKYKTHPIEYIVQNTTYIKMQGLIFN